VAASHQVATKQTVAAVERRIGKAGLLLRGELPYRLAVVLFLAVEFFGQSEKLLPGRIRSDA
jgi:hypothetical protein